LPLISKAMKAEGISFHLFQNGNCGYVKECQENIGAGGASGLLPAGSSRAWGNSTC